MSYAIRDDLKYMEGHVSIRMSTKHTKFYTEEIRAAKCVHSEVQKWNQFVIRMRYEGDCMFKQFASNILKY